MKTRWHVATALVSLLVSAMPGAAAAQVVANGGAPNGGAGWNIFDDNRAATSFSLSGSTSFDAIRFWGILFQNTAYGPNVFWQILSDASGNPGSTVVAEGNGVAGSTLRADIGLGAFSWQFDFAAGTQTLGSGVFWLALHDGPLDPNGFTGSSLLWETSDASGASAGQTFTIDENWYPVGDQSLAFQLRNEPVSAVPEPGTLVLLGTGLASLAGVARRRRVFRNP